MGAIHVGDKRYYDELNAHFKQYDALLYELVAPDGSVVTRGRGTSNRHPVGMLQNGMKQMLELEHQLEQIDYTKPNFVHADMSPDQFAESMRNRGESFLQLYFRLIGQSIGHQSRQANKGQTKRPLVAMPVMRELSRTKLLLFHLCDLRVDLFQPHAARS